MWVKVDTHKTTDADLMWRSREGPSGESDLVLLRLADWLGGRDDFRNWTFSAA
jgi:hypothetical protein